MNRLFVFMAVLLLASPTFAARLEVDGTNEGNFSVLSVEGATASRVNGEKAILEFNTIKQTDPAGAVATLTLDQDDTDQPLLDISCETGSTTTNTCSHYATTQSAKAGTIKIKVNGTTRYINFYETAE